MTSEMRTQVPPYAVLSGEPQTGPKPTGVGEVPLDSAKHESDSTAVPPPSLKDMDKILGYQTYVNPYISFVPPPPSYAEAVQAPKRTAPEEFGQRPQLAPEEARSCLLAFVKEQQCWGTGPVKAMIFNRIEMVTTAHYILSTYHETRVSEWCHEPFTGQPIDGPQNGPPPRPWDISVQTPDWFQDQEIDIEVPHTASVKMCHHCRGLTTVSCRDCNGWGHRSCSYCSGTDNYSTHEGSDQYRQSPSRLSGPNYGVFGQTGSTCYSCSGAGKVRCRYCEGIGRMSCSVCAGSGRAKYYIKLKVTFTTHISDYILERTPLPDELIRNVEGDITFEDTQSVVRPLRTFPEQEVNQHSEALIRQHRQLAKSGRVWMQNHVVREVPVFHCSCIYHDKPLQFYVYGHNRHVFLYDYPQKCCWGCQVL